MLITVQGYRKENKLNRSDATHEVMQKRIEMNRKVMELLWKLERNRTFTGQFKTAQEYVEWTLEEAWKWMDRHPHKEIKGYVDF